MVTVTSGIVKPPEGLLKKFYDIYNDGLITAHIQNKSLKRKVEQLRNELGIDFYNLQEDGEEITVFSDKYLGYRSDLELSWGVSADEVHTFYLIRDEQPLFKHIVDKVLAKQKLTDEELAHIKTQFFGDIMQKQDSAGDWRLSRTFYFMNWGIVRALYEFIMIVSKKAVAVGRCHAPNCSRIFLQGGGGSNQLYCSKACKMRTYRRRKRAST